MDNIQWTSSPIVGQTLLMGGQKLTDSNGRPIDPDAMYRVGKDIESGMLLIIPVWKDPFNERLRIDGQLN